MQWINTTVGDFCSFIYGKAIKKQDQLESGVPVYGSNGIYTYSASQLVGPYSVIIGRKGSVGKLHISFKPCWVSDTAFYVKHESLEDTYFTYYLLSTLGLEGMNTDAAVPGLNRDNAHRLEVRIPESIVDRKKLIEPLIALDEKIQLNQQINQTLEQMAQAIFKSWFVDFEPVKAKIAALEAGGSEEDALLAAMQAISGKDPQQLTQLQTENPEHYTTLRATAELFPAAMQESELGEIPEGWGVGSVSTLFELHRGFDLPKDSREEGPFEVYAAGGLHGTHSEFKMEPPGIITGRSGVIGNVYLSLKKYWPLNTTLYVREFRACGPYYAYHLLGSLDLKALNSGSAVPSLNRNFVHSMDTLKPSSDLLVKFESIAGSMFTKMVGNIDQNVSLENIRDTLLPKLLSGELAIPEAK